MAQTLVLVNVDVRAWGVSPNSGKRDGRLRNGSVIQDPVEVFCLTYTTRAGHDFIGVLVNPTRPAFSDP